MLRISTPIRPRRTAAFALALALGAMALPAQAISVNDMVVWSASGKPLRMDIELVDLQGLNLRNVSLSVASAAEHARVGLTRPEWADSVSFKLLVLDSGKVVARATSSQTVTADFVSFLVSIRGSGITQLQQVASKVSADGAEPLASPQAVSVLARAEPSTSFADKPVAKTVPSPVVIESRPTASLPAPVMKAALVAKPVSAVKESSTVRSAPVPAPVPVAVPASEASASPVQPEQIVASTDAGSEPTLDSLQAERAQLQQQISDLQTRLTAVDQQLEALNPNPAPAAEAPAGEVAAEAPVTEPAQAKLLGYTYFSNIMLGLLAVFMAGMALLDRIRASKR